MSDSLIDRKRGVAEAAHLVPGLLGHDDDRVPGGVHWRVLPAAGSLPAGPVAVRGWFSEIRGSRRGYTTNRPGSALGDIGPGRELLIAVPMEPNTMVGWVLVAGTGRLRVSVVAETLAPNGEYVEITARDEEPWFVASSDITRIRVTGEGEVFEVAVYETNRDAREVGDELDLASLDPAVVDSLPGYAAPLAGAEAPEDRVLRAAPRLPVPYAPRDPWPGYTEADELARVLDLVHRDGQVIEWLQRAYDRLAGGGDGAITQPVGGEQSIRYPASAALGVAAADAGVARWLARAGLLPGWDARWQRGEPAMAVALMPVLVQRLPLRRAFSAAEERYDQQLGGGYAELRGRVRRFPVPGRLRLQWDVELLPMALPFVPETPPAIPVTPVLGLVGEPRWLTDGGIGADPLRTVGWERTVAVRGAAHLGPVSLVHTAAGERRTLHDAVGDVASPLLLAWPQPAVPGTPPSTDTTVRPREAIDSVPDAVTATWRLRLADWTGRWGDPSEIDAAPPAPPAPTPPTIEAVLLRAAVGGTAPASPGSVAVRIRIARPTAPGALPLAEVGLLIDGAAVALAVPDLAAGTGLVEFTHPVPASRPGDRRQLRFEATVTDASGRVSAPAAVAVVHADDARPVPPPTVSPRLLMAGRPGPAPDVTVSLTVRAVAGAAYYRFYTAAETTVRSRLGLGADFRGQPRAVRASALLAAGLPPRDGFTLAATAAVGPGGTATGLLSVPSGTSDVVLVRAVPVTGGVDAYGNPAEGIEAPVHTVTPAYVIVPTDDVPPLPRVSASSPAPGRARVEIVVFGVSTAALGRLPGPVQARLVEVIDGEDPRYWPEIETVPLVADGPGRFAATVELDVPPWARLRFAAAVRFAAEATVVPGADIVVAPDLTAAGPQPDAVAAPWGPLSAPASADVAGAEPIIRSVDDGAGLRVVVDGLPALAAGSSAFTAVVYTGAVELTESERHTLSAESDGFPLVAASAAVVIVDPFGAARAPVPVP